MSKPTGVRAAQYLRMSTEHQKYSIARQSAAIADYAGAHGFEVVETYADEGVSGLGIAKRHGLQRLLADILGGRAAYDTVLVYDVSRWGRFQDPDQSAHYEFICREAGVRVEYCAEPFDNDGSMSAVLLKTLKRVMAAEYSRELSQKTSTSKARAASLGFWVNGPAGYGFRRRVVRADGQLGRILERGDQKGMTERARLVRGPADEIETVRRMYRLFVIGGLRCEEIARVLNAEGCLGEGGARWSKGRVRQVLSNEKYVGTIVFGRTHRHLGRTERRASEAWRRTPGAVPALVDDRLFAAAGRHLRKRWPKPAASSEVMLANLAELYARTGRLSAAVIDADPGTHCSETYKQRFGTLMDAYRQVGFRPTERQLAAARCIRARQPHLYRNLPPSVTDEEMLSGLAALYARCGDITTTLIDADASIPKAFRYRLRYGCMRMAYALVGFVPDLRRQHLLASRSPQAISVAAAQAIADRVPPGGYLLPDAVGQSTRGTPMPER